MARSCHVFLPKEPSPLRSLVCKRSELVDLDAELANPEPKGKTLPGWALWCSRARTVFALGAEHLPHSQRGGADVNSQLRHRTALRRVASSRHTEATPSQARSSVAARS